MFGRKKKEIPAMEARCRSSIVKETLTLIAIANKAESESLRSNENTDVQELRRATAVLEAQSALTESIVLSQSSDLTMREISAELIKPVLDRSVVGEVAQLALDEALVSAEKRMAVG